MIIKKVLAGEPSAFEALVLDNQKKVYNLALKMTGNEEDSLDIAQEAFLKAYAGLHAFRGDSRFSVWMYRMTYNLCIDFLRKRSRAHEVSLTYQNSGDENAGSMELEIPDLRSLPEDGVLRRETRRHIAEGVNELSPKYREIFILREITGMSYEELASTLKLSEGTVKSRLARARKNLAGILVRKGTFPDGVRLKDEKEVRERE